MKFKILVALLALNLTSCDNYLDINEDPNNPNINQVTPALLLPGAMTNAHRVQTRTMNQLGNIWMQNWGADVNNFTQANSDEYRLQLSNNFYTNIWDGLYTSMANFSLITKYNSVNHDNHKAVAMIMKAYYMQYIVDLYGDAPYSQAFQLADDTTPSYDDDKAIYRSLVSEVDDAVQMFYDADSNDEALGTSDVMFNGNLNKWIRFANTLKLRLLLRQSNLVDAETTTYLATEGATLNGAVFLEENATVNPGYNTGTAAQLNPFYSLFKTATGSDTQYNGYTRATAHIADFLNGDASNSVVDLRRSKLYTLVGGAVSGAVQGDLIGPAEMSGVGTGLIVAGTQDGIVLSLAETNFMISEAIEKGIITGTTLYTDAQTPFYAGIEASYLTLGLTSANAFAYIGSSNNVAGIGWDGGNHIEAIMTQKWIATNGINAIESFIDMNRTGYPVLPMPTNALYPTRPLRLLYPTSELVANSANVPSVGLSQIFTQGPFWK